MRRKPTLGGRIDAAGTVCLTGGVDVGSASIKTVLLVHSVSGDEVIAANLTIVGGAREPRDLRSALRTSWAGVLTMAGVSDADVAYVASTGMRDQVAFRVGHFFGRNCQGLGTRLLFPQAAAYLDWGRQQMRCGVIDQSGHVIRRVMRRTELDMSTVAGTVIEMLTAEIGNGPVALIGGRTRERAQQALFEQELQAQRPSALVLASEEGVFAAAYGAALVAARRFRRLSRPIITAPWVRPSAVSPWVN